MLVLLAACSDPSQPPPTFDPVAVGLMFDGVVRADGTLAGYTVVGDTYDPLLILLFASEAYFTATDGATQDAESCVAVATFSPPPSAEPLPTWDGSALLHSYETELPIEAHDCGGAVNRRKWGDDGEGLMDTFRGARLGFGIGPMTDYLRDAWSEETLAVMGPSMLAQWWALNDAEGAWVAGDWTTGLAWKVDPLTSELVTEIDPYYGDLVLVPEVVEGLVPGDEHPDLYLRPYPFWFQDFDLMDLENL